MSPDFFVTYVPDRSHFPKVHNAMKTTILIAPPHYDIVRLGLRSQHRDHADHHDSHYSTNCLGHNYPRLRDI